MDGPGAAPDDADQAFRDLIAHLYSLSRKGMVLGLDRVQRAFDRLGNPERAIDFIHVAGSNGKGSTCAVIASILARDGCKVGLFSSPHLVSLTERVRFFEGERIWDISQSDLHDALRDLECAVPEYGDLTFFEVITVAAVHAIVQAGAAVGVIEAGLGARLDATRLVDASVSVLTPICVEHSAILGDSVEAIAREKVAVLRPGRPLVWSGAPGAIEGIVRGAAQCTGTPLFVAGEHFKTRECAGVGHVFELSDRMLDEVQPGLIGPHQVGNALVAAQAAALFSPGVSDRSIVRGIEHARWPGRAERIEGTPTVVLDGAHNPAAARALVETLAAIDGPKHFVFGVMNDKDVSAMLRVFSETADSWAFVAVENPRAVPPGHLLGFDLRGEKSAHQDVTDALRTAFCRAESDGGSVVVCGSLYLVGAARTKLASDFGRVLT